MNNSACPLPGKHFLPQLATVTFLAAISGISMVGSSSNLNLQMAVPLTISVLPFAGALVPLTGSVLIRRMYAA